MSFITFQLPPCRLKGQSLDHVKIADFGLSEFYRPGGTLTSTSGTLSFQAPEVVSGVSHAGKLLNRQLIELGWDGLFSRLYDRLCYDLCCAVLCGMVLCCVVWCGVVWCGVLHPV